MKMKTVIIKKQMRTGSGVKDLGVEARLVPANYSARSNKDIEDAYRQSEIEFKHQCEAADLLRSEDDE